MHSAFAVAALAAVAVAAPYKRDVVTEVDYVTDVDVVTVMATAVETATAEATATAYNNWGNNHWSWDWHNQDSSTTESTTSVAPTTTSTPIYVAPTTPSTTATPTPTSTYVAPTTTPTSTYVAPTTTPTSTYVAPTTPATTWAKASSTSEAAAAPTDYQSRVVYHHNLHRANHSSPDIAWSDDLASTAQTIASTCNYAHSMNVDGGGYGQNIAAGVAADNISSIITDLFYNGEVNYYADQYGKAQPDMSQFEHFGHFTQIVWADTTHVGCATQQCQGTLGGLKASDNIPPIFTVCNYKTPGNYANEYANNIGKPLDHASADWNTGGS